METTNLILKYCPDCGCKVPVENFYNVNKYLFTYCKKHTKIRQQRSRDKSNNTEFVNHCPPKPNTYFNEEQKEKLFEFMIALGWKFNEENGIWYKEQLKDSNGNWMVKITKEPKIKIVKEKVIKQPKEPKIKIVKTEESKSEYIKEYYQKNKEKYKKMKKEYREKNKEKLREYSKEYYQKHKNNE